MKRQFQLRWLPAAIGLAAMIVALPTECAHARGRRGGFGHGGFGHGGFERGGLSRDFSRGGFSRESPAAAGSFASRWGSMLGHGGFERGAEANRMGQANRMKYGQQAQASRQQEANAMQSNREQTAKSLQSSAQQNWGAYPYGGLGYPAWDAGAAGVAAATGAAIGAAAAVPKAAAPAAGAAYTAGLPCANAAPVSLGPATFYRCGSTWYRQAYGPSGPVFLPVMRPGL